MPSSAHKIRAQILAQFTLVNRMQFNEAKLRDRKQGMEERMIEYYYDVLDLCRWVDPNMGEAVKQGHLWRELKPIVLEKLWSLKPGTCEEFLQEVKRYQEMTSRTRQDEWTLEILGKEDAGQNPTTGQGVSVGDRMERMDKMFGEEMCRVGDAPLKRTERPTGSRYVLAAKKVAT
ncbi:hypothetical protein OUZ56_025423 [Daphnia magna]|uniref:Uncharacterized protein n=1 Tax=Daphnia magna TaxID=35525 RepID=A0ABQ9ZJT9_9CRUS|nr:hypothetical protein OUZ56_025423 [Daphnia magna]